MKTPVRHVLAVIAVIIFASTVSPARTATAATPTGTRYFKETGHNIVARIKTFYEKNGDVATFGLPLTEVIVEKGLQVQYFERARFELHPELPDAYFVSLTQIGRQLTVGRREAAFAPAAGATTETNAYFKETRHNVSGAFLTFWRNRGALPVFGYPLSEEFAEVNPQDGQTYTVQYFERARFEYHPAAPAGAKVQLGLLGIQLLDRSGLPASVRAKAPVVSLIGSATTGYFGSYSERVNNIARGAAQMNGVVVQPGATYSFLTALGPAGPQNGYVDGYAIVGGRLEKVVGGGLCQVSTTMYRAAFYAGVEIVSRKPHSFAINFYENIIGFDATVYAPGTDFKWRNDTAGAVYIATSTNPDKATVTFALYGYDDGRKVQMIGPVQSKVVLAGKPAWQFDPSLGRGVVRQLVHGRPGFDVSMQRIVTDANGKQIRKDNLPSRYRPWEDFYIYGPGVTPPKGVTIIPADTKPAEPTN